MAFRIHLFFLYTSLVLGFIYTVNALKALESPKQLRILDFSWENCGPTSDPAQIKSLTVTPDPVTLPGNLTISVTVAVASPVPTDLHIVVTMEKKVGTLYIKIPCIDNIGSCTYNNLCDDWAQVCPTYFEKYGIPCTCPIPANTYTVSDSTVYINVKLPSIITGGFRVTGDFASSTAHLGCLRLDATLKS